MLNTPILMIAFNKPHTTLQVFQAIRKVQPLKLYIAIDGPRTIQDKKKCNENKALVNKIDWNCEVKTLFREENLGCALGVTSSISWFFDHEPEGIILEDDCLPSRCFFSFCEKLLSRYRDDTRISVISGSNHLLQKFLFESDYYYSHMTHIWGWATWRRSWKDFSLEIKDYETFYRFKLLEHIFPDRLVYNQLEEILKYSLKCDAKSAFWDYCFSYFNMTNHKLSVIPSLNLIKNIGFDGSGNSKGKSEFIYANMKNHEIETNNLKAPNSMIPFYEGDLFTLRNEFKLVSFLQRSSYLLKQFFHLRPIMRKLKHKIITPINTLTL